MAIAVIYRWNVRAGMEDQFRAGWVEGTKVIHAECGSFGARLHRDAEGVFVSYALWPDDDTRQACMAQIDKQTNGFPEMRAAIAEFHGEEVLDITDDELEALDQPIPSPLVGEG